MHAPRVPGGPFAVVSVGDGDRTRPHNGLRPGWIVRLGLSLLLLFVGTRSVGAAVAETPAPDDSLYVLAGKLYSTERYVEAIPLFEQVVSENPGFANAYALLGSSFLHLGAYEQAIENFEKALGLDEGIKLAYLGLITANYYTARLEAAQRWVRKCMPVLSPTEKSRWLSLIQKKFPELAIG
jgi:tetratricopeptide (TPR) repeat protein